MAKDTASIASPAADQSLAAYLTAIRGSLGMTLRDVEKATEKRVSNAYLSQVENDKIARPSPNVLHALAGVYRVSYEVLMEKAGYLPASAVADGGVLRSASKKSNRPRQNAFATQDLTQDEEQELLEYLAFVRSRRGTNAKTE